MRQVLETFVETVEVIQKTATPYCTFPLRAPKLPGPVYVGTTP
jgi:hypothetical protein